MRDTQVVTGKDTEVDDDVPRLRDQRLRLAVAGASVSVRPTVRPAAPARNIRWRGRARLARFLVTMYVPTL